MSFERTANDYRYMFRQYFDVEKLLKLPRYSDFELEDFEGILDAVVRMADEKLLPLQKSGDRHPAVLENGVVRTSPGFKQGYNLIAESGITGMSASPKYGGLGLPRIIQNAANEIINGACISLGLNPLLTQSQIEALQRFASDEIKNLYIPKLVSGEWCGTMDITEPQAGSDVGAIKTQVLEDSCGLFRVSGEKVFISWAESDLAENICHLILARLPGSEPGTRGLSLFLVPKLIPDKSGIPLRRNGIRILTLEKKLGLHGSPTAHVRFENARGWLIGRRGKGMLAMFSMMNSARLAVGFQGVGVAEAAYTQAEDYAATRRQGRSPAGSHCIKDHPDVRRMLLTMRARLLAARAICAACSYASDLAVTTGSEEWQAKEAVLTPIAKSFGSDTAVEVSLQGIKIHGGLGYMEDTGASQFLRDGLVTTIYEGTNGIQALDLVGRKLADSGKAVFSILDEVKEVAQEARGQQVDIADDLSKAEQRLRSVTRWMIERRNFADRLAGSTPYLNALAILLGGQFFLKSLTSCQQDGERASLASTYFRRILPMHIGLCHEAVSGAEDLFEVSI